MSDKATPYVRIRANAKQTAKGEYQVDVTVEEQLAPPTGSTETHLPADTATRLRITVLECENALRGAGKRIAGDPPPPVVQTK